MARKLLKFFSLLVTLGLYGAIVYFFLDYFFTHEPPKKIAIDAQKIDVVIVEEKKEPKKIAPPKKMPSAKSKPPKKSKGSPMPKAAPDIKDLFASLNTKKLAKKKASIQKNAVMPSKYKGRSGKKAQKILKQLKLHNIIFASKKSIKSVRGEKDPYLEKLYKILYANWTPSELSAGNRAKVKITIDTAGSFSYKVIQYSKSDIFNAELDDYLQRMQMQRFPPPARPKEFIVYFEAKE